MAFNERSVPVQLIAVTNSREHGLNAGKDVMSALLAATYIVLLTATAVRAAKAYQRRDGIPAEKPPKV